MEGQKKLKAASVLLHRRRRPRLAAGAVPGRGRASAASASSTSTSSTSATCSGRSSTARRTSAGRSCSRRADQLHGASTRTCRSICTRRRCPRRTRWRSVRDLRHHRRRHGQLPDALPRERRVRAAGQAERLRQHLPLRGPGVGVLARRTARATAACIPSRRRRAWCPSCAEGGVLGVLPGIIGAIQATEAIKLILGIGEPLIGRLPALRRAADEVPRAEAAEGPELPGLRHAPDHHGADRLRAVLRRSPAAADADAAAATSAGRSPRSS